MTIFISIIINYYFILVKFIIMFNFIIRFDINLWYRGSFIFISIFYIFIFIIFIINFINKLFNKNN